MITIGSIIYAHAKTLAIKHNQMIYKDDYGNFILGKWDNEVKYFIENVLYKDNAIRQFLTGGINSQENQARFLTVKEMIFEVASTESAKMSNSNAVLANNFQIDVLTGEEFERHCVSILNQYGWHAKTTKSTGDQGIDIVGKIYGITVVFQCKRHAQPVGNSAVQEALAGKTFARAQVAAVVTNNTFTVSARQLAQSANVYLLHHTELKEFANMILVKK